MEPGPRANLGPTLLEERGARFRAETGFEPLFSLKDIFRTLRTQRSA